MRVTTCTFLGHVALLTALETPPLLSILDVFLVGKFLEWELGCYGSGVDLHGNNAGFWVAWHVCTLSLAGLERSGVTWLVFAAEFESCCGRPSYFVNFCSRSLNPFNHCDQFLVLIQDSLMDILLKALSIMFNCSLGIGLPPCCQG